MHLLYLTFGKKFSVHLQAAFSIYSFLAAGQSVRSITVMTDAPEYYRHLSGRVTIAPLDAATLKEWEGPHRFFWRVKIKAIQAHCQLHSGEPVLYLDGDTFCHNDTPGLARLLQTTAAMHENEGPLAKAATKTERRMWGQVKGKTYSGYTLPLDACMWNAGVVGLPNTTDGAECAFALEVCDEMCATGVTRRLIEQFALAVSLQRFYGLQPAEAFIAHYWSTKEAWDGRINQFFTEAFLQGTTPDALPAQLNHFDFNALPVRQVKKNTGRRLHQLVDRLFPDKHIGYASK